ncbi:MAG: TPM domain-containing protein [Marinilabiliaceae bacterium]|nr:TPM domain-containing protein [Marinilabiliaceae bacterium]
MIMLHKLLLFILLFSVYTSSAQSIPDKTNPPRLVNDFAGILKSSEVEALENYLVKFNNETSTQVVVVTVTSLDGTDASDYTFKLGEKWGVGQKGKNNGIVILIKPKYNTDKGHAFIATGYGIEGAVPDAIASQIVDNDMIPHFKKGDYFGGISAAVNTITQLTKGEYTADEYVKKHKKTGGYVQLIVFVVFAIIILIAKSGRGSRTYSSSGSSLPLWLLLGGMASGSRHHGNFGNFSSGSGGFGGFGGGSFGGGGAGGSW